MKNKFSFVIFFVLIHSYVISQDISRTIYSLLNFHSHEIITSRDLYTQPSKISSRFVYNDYYRKYINGQQKIDWNGYNREISTWHSHIGKDLNYGLKTNIQFSEYDFQNVQDKKALRIQNDKDFNSINFQIALSDEKSFLGVGMVYRKTKNSMPILITEFPGSVDDNMNEYFLDYLEPTFGKNVSIIGNSVLRNPLIFTSFPINKKYYITILISHLFQKYNIDIDYTNSSNIDELTGNRSIEIPAGIRNSFIQAILSNKSNSIQSSATYFKTDISAPFNNFLPANYTNPILRDYETLGYIRGSHRGGAIEFNYSRTNYQLLLGLGLGNLSGSVEMVTPVLGEKNIIIFPFPISHGVGGEITGTNSSQKISFNYNKLYKNIKFELLSSYTHGYYDLLIDGDAQLFFDLISTPVFYTLNYHTHFFDFKGNIKQQIGNINIIYSLNQIIPIIWRTDSSPIKFKYEPPIDPTPTEPGISHETEDVNFWEWDYISENLNKHRGGRSYSISIQYSW